MQTNLTPSHALRTIILGGDTLAFRVCGELRAGAGRVSVIAAANADVENTVVGLGASFVPHRGEDRDSLVAADVTGANVAMALTEDDQWNLQFALAARDLNPKIRIVMRQFSRTLGRKIADSLPDCSVISLSSLSAATYAAAALDRDCFYGVEFPYVDGRLVGFATRTAADSGVAGLTVGDAERRLDARIVVLGSPADSGQQLQASDALLVIAVATQRDRRAEGGYARGLSSIADRFRALANGLARPDPVVRGALLSALLVFTLATVFFSLRMNLGLMTAAYFVFSTMTTTGYGDITPPAHDSGAQAGAMVLMLAGLTFSGIFIAVLSSRFTQLRYVATQGLRRVRRRGHIVVCGAGNVGSRVIDYLVRSGARVVVVEQSPQPELIERARAGDFEILTGDAGKDRTLELCNVVEADAVVAITNSDTMNLDVALGARARNRNAQLVMRVQHRHFAESIGHHFELGRVYGTAALAAPVFAGLAGDPGMRGHITTTAGHFSVVEMRTPVSGPFRPPAGAIALAAWRDGRVVPMADVMQARTDETVLLLVPAP